MLRQLKIVLEMILIEQVSQFAPIPQWDS